MSYTDRDEYEAAALESAEDERAWIEQRRAERVEHVRNVHVQAMMDAWRWPEPIDTRTPLEIAAQRVADADSEARAARREWIALLPELDPDTLTCPACNADPDDGNWTVREVGYERWTTSVEVTTIDDDWAEQGELYLRPYADGWDDMTEGGAHEWLICTCGACYPMPARTEWF